MKPTLLATAVGFCSLITLAPAAISITNGDFNTAPAADNQTDVTGWYDYDSGNFWEQTWLEAVDVPSGPAMAFAGGAFLNRSWAYQAIGTADGATSMTVRFDYGSFADANTNRDIGFTWTVYAATGSFTPGQNVDIATASGVTLLSFGSVSATGVAPGANAGPASVTLDLSGAGSSLLYLRVNNFSPTTSANDNGYGWVDNITATTVPECSSSALAVVTASVLLRRRRR